MSFKASLFIGVLLGLVGGVPVCWAGAPSADLQKVESKLAEEKARAETLNQQQQVTAQDLKKLQRQLVQATETLQKKQAEAEKLGAKLDELAAANAEKVTRYEASRVHFEGMTRALSRLSREPPEALLFQTTLNDDQIHRAILLRETLPRVQQESEALAAELADLQRVQVALAEQKKLVAATQQNIAWQKNNLDQMVKIRQGALQKTAVEREALTQQLKDLTSEAADLRALMQKVSQTAAFSRGLDKTTREMSLKKGLRLPVNGRLLRGYGVRDAYGVQSQGLAIVGNGGAPIVAPATGRVVFAGPFRGYGLIVILAHGGGYHSFLAGFGRINAEIGQNVVVGEPLGALPDSAAHPEMYFEWRFHNEPVDPEK